MSGGRPTTSNKGPHRAIVAQPKPAPLSKAVRPPHAALAAPPRLPHAARTSAGAPSAAAQRAQAGGRPAPPSFAQIQQEQAAEARAKKAAMQTPPGFRPAHKPKKRSSVVSGRQGEAVVSARAGLVSADGASGNHEAVNTRLKKDHYHFWRALTDSVENQKRKGGGIFSCAEPDAVSRVINELVKTTDPQAIELSSIVITRTLNRVKGLVEPPCATCSQWVIDAGDGTYRIRPAIIAAASPPAKIPKATAPVNPGIAASKNPYDALLLLSGDGSD